MRLMLRSVPPSWAKPFHSAHLLGKFHQEIKGLTLQWWSRNAGLRWLLRVSSIFYMKWSLDKILERGTGFLPGWYFNYSPGEPGLLSPWADERNPSMQGSTEFSSRDWQMLQLPLSAGPGGWEGVGVGFLGSSRTVAWCYPSRQVLWCLGCVKDGKVSWHRQTGFERKWNLMLQLSRIFEAASFQSRLQHLSHLM